MICVTTCFNASNVAHGPVFKRKLIAVDHGNGVIVTGTSLQSSTQDREVTLLPCLRTRSSTTKLWPHVVKRALTIDSLRMPIKGA